MRNPTLISVILALAGLLGSGLSVGAAEPSAVVAETTAAKRLAADTPMTTVLGNTFIAPAEWTVEVVGPATIVGAPEGDSWVALVDLPVSKKENDAASAVAAAWAAYKPTAAWPLRIAIDLPDRNGWTHQQRYDYQTSPNERRDVSADVRQAGGVWSVAIYDVTQPVGEKRSAQLSLLFGRLLPKGYTRETFGGKTAHQLDAQRLGELSRFVETGMASLGVPGVAVGIVENGKVVLAKGFGTRALGQPEPVDADTMFMVASNTKALTTLLLAKLVADGKVSWDTPATKLLPSFRLGDADTTAKVLVKHLICACTGLPRQDLEWLFEFADVTPRSALDTLATMVPTSGFGELFQYSNPMAGAAGFAAGHLLYPELELGAAYDRAMSTEVFAPLGMTSTTFDYAVAQAGNYARPHALDFDGKTAPAAMEINYAVIPLRPAGAAWSNVRDMLRYVQLELDEGLLPNGQRFIAREPLLARREPQVAIGKDASYGMGLMVNTTYDQPVVHHGGDLIGYHSDMMWLPGQRVGAVILTNGDPGWVLRSQFRRKLLEVLFDGQPEADAQVAAGAKAYRDGLATERALLTIPADPIASGKLAARYRNPALGEIATSRDGAVTRFDFGEWKSEVASRQNPDGTTSFLTLAPGAAGFELVVGTAAAGKRTLVVRDAQHEYVFSEQ